MVTLLLQTVLFLSVLWCIIHVIIWICIRMEIRISFHHFCIGPEIKRESSIVTDTLSLTLAASKMPGLSFLVSRPLGGVRGQCQWLSFRWHFLWCKFLTLSLHTRFTPYETCNPSDPPWRKLYHPWTGTSLLTALTHYAPLSVCNSCLGGEQNTRVHPQTHTLSNQLSRWSREGEEKEKKRVGRALISHWGYFFLHTSFCFCHRSLPRILQALKNKEMSFFSFDLSLCFPDCLFWLWYTPCFSSSLLPHSLFNLFSSTDLPSPFFYFPPRRSSRYE